ncbi:MAG: hypothetical protein MJE77_06835 [Proteobacteria bacterium]|nr:hypothetical protein [Pseudomonadota bacterium]
MVHFADIHEGEDLFLDVDSTTTPYGDRVLRTERELEDRGWSHAWCGESTRRYESGREPGRKKRR